MPLPRQKPWLPEKGPGDFVFTNANVLDITGNATLSSRTVHTSSGKIVTISAGGDEKAPTASGQTIVDLKGKYLMPGLIDCHVHLTATAGGATMRDLFDAHPNTIAYRCVLILFVSTHFHQKGVVLLELFMQYLHP
jgi:predicted amidohydrolase YtcJ